MTHADLAQTVIAVDGGGSTCRLVLDRPGGQIVVTRGAANVSSDLDAAIGEIRAGLEALAAKAEIAPDAMSGVPAYLGLAGMIDATIGEQVRAALPLQRARVEDDRPAALRGALGGRDGAIAHFGTGSFFALQAGDTRRLAGGWGWRLGDEGSGYWVARAALNRALGAADGLFAPSPLTEEIMALYGSPAGIVARVARETPKQTARLAPHVASAAGVGDAVGEAIMREGAGHIVTTLDRLGWRAGMDLCLTGGFAPCYAPYLPDALATALVASAGAPIDGAVALAHAFAAEVGT